MAAVESLAASRHTARSKYYKEPWNTSWLQARRNARRRRWLKRLSNKRRRREGKEKIQEESYVKE